MFKKLTIKTAYDSGNLVPVWLSKEAQAVIVEICKVEGTNLDDVVNSAIQNLGEKHQVDTQKALLALQKSPSKLVH
jgi:hypothetical protein